MRRNNECFSYKECEDMIIVGANIRKMLETNFIKTHNNVWKITFILYIDSIKEAGKEYKIKCKEKQLPEYTKDKLL